MRFKTSFPMMTIFLCLICSGCGNKSIIVQPGTVGVVMSEIQGAKVAFPDSSGNLVTTTCTIPVGADVKVPKPK